MTFLISEDKHNSSPGQCRGKVGTCIPTRTAELNKLHNPERVAYAPGLGHGDIKDAPKCISTFYKCACDSHGCRRTGLR